MGGDLALCESLLGPPQHPDPHPADEERAERADEEHRQHGPPEPDVVADRDERDDLGEEQKEHAGHEHLEEATGRTGGGRLRPERTFAVPASTLWPMEGSTDRWAERVR